MNTHRREILKAQIVYFVPANIWYFLKTYFKPYCLSYWSSQQTRSSKYSWKRDVSILELKEILDSAWFELVIIRKI